MQLFTKFFLTSLLVLVVAAPALSVENGVSHITQRCVLSLMPSHGYSWGTYWHRRHKCHRVQP